MRDGAFPSDDARSPEPGADGASRPAPDGGQPRQRSEYPSPGWAPPPNDGVDSWGQPQPCPGQIAGPPSLRPRRSRTGVVVAAGISVLAVTVVLVVGWYAYWEASGVPEREVISSATAGGLERSEMLPGNSPLFAQVSSAVEAVGFMEGSSATSVYENGASAADHILFRGGTGRIGGPGGVGGPEEFLTRFAESMDAEAIPVDPGPGGGDASCGITRIPSGTSAYCGWATDDSYGILVSNTAGTSPQEMADIMLGMRPDLERPVD